MRQGLDLLRPGLLKNLDLRSLFNTQLKEPLYSLFKPFLSSFHISFKTICQGIVRLHDYYKFNTTNFVNEGAIEVIPADGLPSHLSSVLLCPLPTCPVPR